MTAIPTGVREASPIGTYPYSGLNMYDPCCLIVSVDTSHEYTKACFRLRSDSHIHLKAVLNLQKKDWSELDSFERLYQEIGRLSIESIGRAEARHFCVDPIGRAQIVQATKPNIEEKKAKRVLTPAEWETASRMRAHDCTFVNIGKSLGLPWQTVWSEFVRRGLIEKSPPARQQP